jgi:hypothetical protein
MNYKVTLMQKVYQHAVVELEAANEDDAREAAERMWRSGDPLEWTEDDVDESFGVEAEVITPDRPLGDFADTSESARLQRRVGKLP